MDAQRDCASLQVLTAVSLFTESESSRDKQCAADCPRRVGAMDAVDGVAGTDNACTYEGRLLGSPALRPADGWHSISPGGGRQSGHPVLRAIPKRSAERSHRRLKQPELPGYPAKSFASEKRLNFKGLDETPFDECKAIYRSIPAVVSTLSQYIMS
jgi:hypothetical protein